LFRGIDNKDFAANRGYATQVEKESPFKFFSLTGQIDGLDLQTDLSQSPELLILMHFILYCCMAHCLPVSTAACS
jgi:hypothetical protein